jgi:hypothetical protein
MCIYETKSYQTVELRAVVATMLVDLGSPGLVGGYCGAKKKRPNGALSKF